MRLKDVVDNSDGLTHPQPTAHIGQDWLKTEDNREAWKKVEMNLEKKLPRCSQKSS